MAKLTPIEEYEKSLREQTRALSKQTSELRTPFRQLIGEVQNVNAEFAKIAADNIGQTQDTWKGLITQGKKQKLIDEQMLDEKFARDSKTIERQKANQAELETKQKEIEEKHLKDREEALKKDTYGKNSLAALNEDKLALEQKYNNSNSNQRIKIAKELDALAGTISSRESSLTKVIDADKDSEIKAIDDRIKREQEEAKIAAKYVDETNEALENNLEDASKTENFDKFTGSIKTLTGGMIDIEGFLDPIGKTLGAMRDLGDVMSNAKDKIFGPITEGLDSVGQKLFGKEDSLEENLEGITEATGEQTKTAKKDNKIRLGFMGKLGMGTLVLGAFLAAVILLYNKFEKFAGWVDNFMGWNQLKDQKDDFDDTTSEFTEGLDDGEVTEKEIKDYEEETKGQIAEQEKVVEQEELTEDLKAGQTATEIARATMANMKTPTTTSIANIADNIKAPTALASNVPGPNLPNAVKPGSTAKVVAKEAGKQVLKHGTSLLKMTSRGLLPVSALLTQAEVMANLQESKDIEADIEAMYDSGELAEDDYKALKEALAEKRKEDVRKPWWQSGVALGVASAVGWGLTFTGVGTAAGIAIVAGTATVASMATGHAVDKIYTGDDFLEEKGFLQTVDSTSDNLEEMKAIQQETITKGRDILTATQEVEDVKAAGSNAGTAIASATNTDASTTITAAGGSSPTDPNQRAVNE